MLLTILIWVVVALTILVGEKTLRTNRVHETDGHDQSTATAASRLVGAMFVFVMAFLTFDLWNDRADASDAVEVEYEKLQLLEEYGEAFEGSILPRLRAYVTSIEEDEWPLMPDGRSSPVTERRFHELQSVVLALEPVSGAELSRYDHLLDALDEAEEARRHRIKTGGSGIPWVLWLTIAPVTLATLGIQATYPGGRHTFYKRFQTVTASVVIGSVLTTVVLMSNPYEGPASLGSGEITAVEFGVLDPPPD